MKRLLLITLLLTTLLSKESRVSYIEVTSITKGSLSQKHIFSGTVTYNQKSNIASRSSGLVSALFFDYATEVTQGDLLVTLDAQVLRAEIDGLKALLQEATLKRDFALLELARHQKLLDKKLVSQQVYDESFFKKEQMRVLLSSLEAKLMAEEIALREKHIYAPFSGVISQRAVEKGEWVSTGATVATLINPNKIDILFHLPTHYLSSLKEGAVLPVTINEKRYQAHIIGKLLEGDATTRTFPLLVRLKDKGSDFFEGMQATLNVEKNLAKEILFVPRDALIRKGAKHVVYLYVTGNVQMVRVDVVGYRDGFAGIRSDDLKEGMDVIVKGNERLYPGIKVTLQ
jgi:membrane fusion protein, multidrug efflux system